MDISKLLLNPARLRIMQYINLKERVTASQIVEGLGDIPRATVYHHVKLLEEHGLIETVEENRVRGAMEKVYASRQNDIVSNGENTEELASAFIMSLAQEISMYLKKEDADCIRDKVFFQSSVLSVTDEEYKDLLKDMAELLGKYVDLPKTENRKFRKLSIVSTIPE